MSIHNLDALFRPSSVAVIGASRTPGRVGSVVMRNLVQGGFAGPILPVNPKHQAVRGVLAYPDVASLPLTPDLAVIATPPRTVPQIAAELAQRGTKAAVVLTAGLQRERTEDGRTLDLALAQTAREYGLRILGPNCVGLLSPHVALNASFAHTSASPGNIAFVSQSGALCTMVLDWAQGAEVGFSCFVSLGDALDVDFGDVIDYLGSDPHTQSILLYIESIQHARKFMSALRAAARNKPVIAIKSGRVEEGGRAAASHTGALAGSDDVFDYALRRAGALRVTEIQDLFSAVETLARSRPLRGNRLAILTNGGGPGVMATDSLVLGGGVLAELSAETMQALDELLPVNWSHGNPVDVIGDAPPDRFARALEIVAADRGVDGVLIMFAPTAVADATETARAAVVAARDVRVPVLASWLGGPAAAQGRREFVDGGLPSYDTPADAVFAFQQMVEYRRNHRMLMQTPPSLPAEIDIDPAAARAVCEVALAAGREWLTEPEAKTVLEAYGIPTVTTRVATNADEAVACAREIGMPVALKVLSPDVLHKSDVGGVVLDIETEEELRKAAEGIASRMREFRPGVEFGFTVQSMARRSGAHELLVGVATDPIFGPYIVFGRGGVAVEVIADSAVAIPPLNVLLAEELVERTRVARLLAGYRDRPAADRAAIHRVLIQISQLLVDIPEVCELDINPLLADENGVLALDARMRVAESERPGASRLAIRPYPSELEEELELRAGLRVLMRPIRPEDEPAHKEFFGRLEPEDVRFRFFSLLRELAHSQLARYTQIDYDREMAFLAVDLRPGNEPRTLGVVRTVTDADNKTAEFAIIIRSDLKGHGLGPALMEKMIRYCRGRGTAEIVGRVLPDNRRMLELTRKLGFEERRVFDEGDVEVRLRLSDGGSPGTAR